VIVRDDLPIGVAAAQIVHAAGESSPGSLPEGTFAVVLSVKDEHELLCVSRDLTSSGIAHKLIREPDLPWAGAAMTIGVKPLPRSTVRSVLKHLRLYGEKHHGPYEEKRTQEPDPLYRG
jgi:peptidyl-tRNA hydrolase